MQIFITNEDMSSLYI